MATIAQCADVWPPQAGGSIHIVGGKFCNDTRTGFLRRLFAVGSNVALIYECNGKPLQSQISVKDGELAQRIVDLVMQHQDLALADIGKLEL